MPTLFRPWVKLALGLPVSATPGPDDWTDVTNYVRSVQTATARRARDLDQFQPGSATIVLGNKDRRFDPKYTAGPYYGRLLPLSRVQVGYGSDPNPIFSGLLDGFPQGYWQDRDAVAQIACVDGFNVLNRAKLDTPWAMAMAKSQPTHWWRIGDAVAQDAYDEMTGTRNGTYVSAPKFGQSGLVAFDDANSTVFGSGSYLSLPESTYPHTATWSVECWFRHPAPVEIGSGYEETLLIFGSLGTGSVFQLSLDAYEPGYRGILEAWVGSGFTHGSVESNVRVDDGMVHHTMVTRSATQMKLYLDGVLQGSAVLDNFAIEGGGYHAVGNVTFGFQYNGPIASYATYDGVVLSANDAAEHYAAGATGWNGEASGTRIGRILDHVGWPSTLRDVDPGASRLQGVKYSKSDNALAAVQSITTTEQGAFYMDTNGKARFRDRGALSADSHYATVQAHFADDGTNLPYSDVVPSQDWAEMFNVVEVSRANGATFSARDQASVDQYGPLVLPLSNLVMVSDNEAQVMAEWLLARYVDPKLRFTALKLNVYHPRARAAMLAAVIPLHPEYRVQVDRRPQHVGTAMQEQVFIEGITHSITANPPTWSIELVLGQTYGEANIFILDDPVHGLLDSSSCLLTF